MKTSISNTPAGVRFTAVVIVALGLTACSYDASDLRDYVAEVKARPGGELEPVPGFPIFDDVPAISQAADPFASFLAEELEGKAEPIDPQVPPWPPHNPEELERHALDSLRMVGTLEQRSEEWALVRDPAGVIHRVRAGNYMGQNYGKILEISQQRIRILEKVSDGRGRWADREAELALSE